MFLVVFIFSRKTIFQKNINQKSESQKVTVIVVEKAKKKVQEQAKMDQFQKILEKANIFKLFYA